MTETRIDYHQRITDLLPDHTHRTGPGIFNLFGGTTWAWTTPAGAWSVVWGAAAGPSVVTPYGTLALFGAPEVSFERLSRILAVLGGIDRPDLVGAAS
jgi:hypothetical protein